MSQRCSFCQATFPGTEILVGYIQRTSDACGGQGTFLAAARVENCQLESSKFECKFIGMEEDKHGTEMS